MALMLPEIGRGKILSFSGRRLRGRKKVSFIFLRRELFRRSVLLLLRSLSINEQPPNLRTLRFDHKKCHLLDSVNSVILVLVRVL